MKRLGSQLLGMMVAGVVVVAAPACGDATSDGAPASTTTRPATSAVTTTTTAVPTTTTQPAAVQPAVWPAPDVVFATPQEAAADFLAGVFRSPGPALGEFRAGDARSGEMEVFAADEAGGPLGEARSTLILRQLGPAGGWFVLGAASDRAFVSDPESLDTVAAGPLVVSGRATGFEANIGIRAFVAGRRDSDLDATTTLAGNFGDILPYEVTLDLSAARPGEVVVLLVHGGAGLETDPGDFSAIPVVIGPG